MSYPRKIIHHGGKEGVGNTLLLTRRYVMFLERVVLRIFTYVPRQIEVTRQMLEPIITRPRLTDKLLNMPPFRFLHDIVSEVIKHTGFGAGLYSAEEMDSALVKAKPAKV
ncbi:unnamed protein product [Sphacelaria rigidula]